MLARTTEQAVGTRTLSGGGVLTRTDRWANDQVGQVTKAAADAVRVPAAIRAGLAADQQAAHQLDKWVGQATALAAS